MLVCIYMYEHNKIINCWALVFEDERGEVCVGGKTNPLYYFDRLPPVWYQAQQCQGKLILFIIFYGMQKECPKFLLKKIIYCYSQYQPLFEDMKQNIPNVILYQGLPSRSDRRMDGGCETYGVYFRRFNDTSSKMQRNCCSL